MKLLLGVYWTQVKSSTPAAQCQRIFDSVSRCGTILTARTAESGVPVRQADCLLLVWRGEAQRKCVVSFRGLTGSLEQCGDLKPGGRNCVGFFLLLSTSAGVQLLCVAGVVRSRKKVTHISVPVSLLHIS